MGAPERRGDNWLESAYCSFGIKKEAIKAMEILRTPDDRFTDLYDYPFEPHYIYRQIVLI